MAGDFTVEVPIRVKGSRGGAGGGDLARTGLVGAGAGLELGGKAGKMLTKIGGAVAGIAVVITALDFIIKPVMQILRAVIALLFIPLIPILIPLLKIAGRFITDLAESSKAMMALVQRIVDFFTTGQIVDFVKSFFGNIWDSLVGAFELLITFPLWLWENILVPGFMFLINVGQMIWNQILLPAFSWFAGIGDLIWNVILKPAWDWFAGIGVRIWEILKGAFFNAVDIITGAIGSLFSGLGGRRVNPASALGSTAGDFISRPGQPLQAFSSDDTIVGFKGSAGLGRPFVININNPVVREEADLRRLANIVGQALQGQLKRRIS